MNSYQLQQIQALYFDILCALLEMLRKYAAPLGLMVPGIPEQLAIENGIDVTANGVPLFRAAVKRRREVFRSPRAFGQAVQEALDMIAYENCFPRLVLVRVDQLPGGYVGLTLTVEG